MGRQGSASCRKQPTLDCSSVFSSVAHLALTTPDLRNIGKSRASAWFQVVMGW